MSSFAARLCLYRSFLNRSLPCVHGSKYSRSVSQCVNHVVASTYNDIEIPSTNLAQYVMEYWPNFADKAALKCGETGRVYKYNKLNDAVHRLAANLTNMGIKQGDVVFLLSPNSVDYAAIYLATILIGAIITTNNPAYTATEVATAISLSDCKLIFSAPEQLAVVKQALDSLQGKHNVQETIVIGEREGYRPLSSILSDDTFHSNTPDLDYKNHVAALPFSNGTTGLPKGVMLTHNNILSNIAQLKASELPLDKDDILTGVPPFYHIYGQVVTLLLGLRTGATTVTMRKFDFKALLQTIADEKVTIGHLVPPIILGLIKSDLTNNYDLSSLSLIITGGAPLKQDQAVAFITEFPQVELLQGYGLTETSPAVTLNIPSRNNHGSVGILLPNVQSKVVDTETGKSLPINEPGELYFSGPNVMKGYWRNEKATDDCLRGNWFRTGDIGYYDEQGHLFVVDRLKELIKYKGFQVAPAELEALLLTHPKVLDSAVISVPCDKSGELPRAYVVVKPGHTVSDEEIHAHIKEKAADYKQLRGGIRWVKEIPKSNAGKILRRLLKEEAAKDG